jgi:uncharacterized pyridoxamine 5'-phosphate oxidase family protein
MGFLSGKNFLKKPCVYKNLIYFCTAQVKKVLKHFADVAQLARAADL